MHRPLDFDGGRRRLEDRDDERSSGRVSKPPPRGGIVVVIARFVTQNLFALLAFTVLLGMVVSSRYSAAILALRKPASDARLVSAERWTTEVNRENAPDGIHVVTTFFRGRYSLGRHYELLMALRRNLANPHVTAVHVLWEDVNPRNLLVGRTGHHDPLMEKLIPVRYGRQPTYSELFLYANTHLGRGAIAIVTNADIYFDGTLGLLVRGGDDADDDGSTSSRRKTALALTRRHATECRRLNDMGPRFDLCEARFASLDTFVFAPPLPEEVMRGLNHSQNRKGAENIVLWTMARSRAFATIANPCFEVHAFHLHCTGERNYDKSTFISRGRHMGLPPNTTWLSRGAEDEKGVFVSGIERVSFSSPPEGDDLASSPAKAESKFVIY